MRAAKTNALRPNVSRTVERYRVIPLLKAPAVFRLDHVPEDATIGVRTQWQFNRRVITLACIGSCCLVALDLWANRDLFDPEGITYLDMADAYLRGDWRAALVGLWNPLYSWLLALVMVVFHPSGRWEFTAVHVLDYFIFLVELGSFTVFIGACLRAFSERVSRDRVPDWAWLAFGYALFTWASIRLTPPFLPEPDSIVCAIIYLVFALLLRMSWKQVGWGESAFLGLLLGIGYLTKPVMFPLAFVILAVAGLLAWRSGLKPYKPLFALLMFLSLSLPYVVALSNAQGRWMFSDTGRLNFAWEINGVRHWSHWQGEGRNGTPIHPTRKIHDDPEMFEFGTPFAATYPPWYDPSYWYAGVETAVDVPRQLSVLIRNTTAVLFFLANAPGPVTQHQRTYYDIDDRFERTVGCLLSLGCVMVMVNRRRIAIPQRIAGYWFLLVPLGAALGAYALYHFEGRYIAAYVVVLWMLLFLCITVPHSEESKRIFTGVVATCALITIMTTALGTGQELTHALRVFMTGKTGAPFFQSGFTNWKVAEYLHAHGLNPGQSVGAIGYTYTAYWARMARLRVVAEIPEEGRAAFWASDDERKAEVMQLFRGLGVEAVVANGAPSTSLPARWERVADTDYYVYLLSSANEGAVERDFESK